MSANNSATANTYNTRIHSLDFNTHNSNTTADAQPVRCGTFVLHGPSSKPGHTLFRRQFCKTYGCPVCGEIRKSDMVRSIINLFLENNLTTFATFTLPPSTCAPEDSIRVLAKMWNQHRITQRRHLGRSPKYVKVVELQKNGMGHLHVLFDQNIPHDWLFESWAKLGGGFVYLEEGNIRSAYYMCKYLSKALDRSVYGNYRRVSASKGLRLHNRSRNPAFAFSKAQYPKLKQTFQAAITEVATRKSGLETGFEIEGLVSLFR